ARTRLTAPVRARSWLDGGQRDRGAPWRRGGARPRALRVWHGAVRPRALRVWYRARAAPGPFSWLSAGAPALPAGAKPCHPGPSGPAPGRATRTFRGRAPQNLRAGAAVRREFLGPRIG